RFRQLEERGAPVLLQRLDDPTIEVVRLIGAGSVSALALGGQFAATLRHRHETGQTRAVSAAILAAAQQAAISASTFADVSSTLATSASVWAADVKPGCEGAR